MSNTRRDALRKISIGMAGALSVPLSLRPTHCAAKEKTPAAAKFSHSVCRWCYQSIPLEAFCEQVKPLGISSVELPPPAAWPPLQRHGLGCAAATDGWVSLTKGWNQTELHEKLRSDYEKLVLAAAENGTPTSSSFPATAAN